MNEWLSRVGRKIKRGIQKSQKSALNSQKNKTLLLLIILSGLFCFRLFWPDLDVYAEADQIKKEAYLKNIFQKDKKESVSPETEERRKILASFSDALNLERDKTKKPSLEEMELYNLVENYPIEKMVPFIAKYDRKVSAFVVGIAKKESDWGKRAPSKNGETCYNYWGYKGAGARGTAMGYACFGNPEEAVKAAAGRIEYFVNKKLDTPGKLVIWKCGRSCAWDNPANVAKWIADVSVYYNQIAYKN